MAGEYDEKHKIRLGAERKKTRALAPHRTVTGDRVGTTDTFSSPTPARGVNQFIVPRFAARYVQGGDRRPHNGHGYDRHQLDRS